MMQMLGLGDVGSMIARFHRERPLVNIQPRATAGGSAEIIAQIRGGMLDAAFVAVSGQAQAGLAVMTLASEPVLLGCPPGHPLTRRDAVSVSGSPASRSSTSYRAGAPGRPPTTCSPGRAWNGRSASRYRTRRFTRRWSAAA